MAAGGALAIQIPQGLNQTKTATALPEHPNLLFILTDQERAPQHWGSFDLTHLLPARQKLLDEGLSFNRAFCNSSMCSPSRACLMTGLYAPQHGLTHTLTYNLTALSDTEVPLSPFVPNLARMLESAGYTVALKGKWHLSKDIDGNAPGADDVKQFGFQDWEATIAGEATSTDAFGGGCKQNDATIIDQAIAWLNQANLPQPFALLVMLANPHDVLAYPSIIDTESCNPDKSYSNTADWTWGIDLPPTFSEDLSAQHKPAVQNASLGLYNAVLGTLNNTLDQKKYVNFYAYLHTLVDQQIDRLLGAIQSWDAQKRPVIIRAADHGEMGLAHGGLRQKMFNAYEETIHLPLIISHPNLPFKGQTTNALASLVDILPTVASLANVPNKESWRRGGVDLMPVVNDPTTSVQTSVLFTFDDDRAGTGYDPSFLTSSPMAHHIRCVRADYNGKEWKFARYFNPAGEAVAAEEFELYNLSDDALEQNNLYNPTTPSSEQTYLRNLLSQMEAERLNPLHFTFEPTIQK